MELGEALERIAAIRVHVARTGVFRGYKSTTVACTGLLAFLASAVQPLIVPSPLQNIHQYLLLWIGVAVVSVICVGIELTTRYVTSDSPLQQAQTRLALEVPQHIVVVAIYYLLAGVACLAMASEAHALSPGAMAGTFGVGQLLTAAILYLGLERRDADC
jgi:hypothetical protein